MAQDSKLDIHIFSHFGVVVLPSAGPGGTGTAGLALAFLLRLGLALGLALWQNRRRGRRVRTVYSVFTT